MKDAKAFAPCHITGVFQIFDQSENALYVGSRGAGVSLSQGVETFVKVKNALRNSWQVKINGFASDAVEVSKHVLNTFRSRFGKMENFEIVVEHYFKVPMGTGFGTSGAAALSLALALNEVFSLGMSKTEASRIAHVAEVECRTGLGTVIAETFGGVEIRVKPGAPGIGEVKHVPVTKDVVVVCMAFGPLLTKKLLTNEEVCRRINELGGKLVNRLIEEPNVTNFMRLSRQFAEHVGLMSERVRKVLKATDDADIVCSMPMFGESVFTLIERDSLEELIRILRDYNSDGQVIISEIDFEGARTLQ